MNCAHCRKKLDSDEPKCPYCGAARPDAGSGVFQSSTVLISAEGSETFYRSVDEVPDSLKTKLLKSTNSSNSATILIADRRGRKEIAKAMRSLPGTAQRRMLHSILGGAESASSGPAWITPNRRKAILGVLLALALALVAFVFTRR
jgi:RNA polymerase subunit RPABC4/transcription elongation factor Spt4